MAKPKDEAELKAGRIHVEVSLTDRIAMSRMRRKLQEMSEAGLARILLHYGIRHAAEAMSELLQETDEQ